MAIKARIFQVQNRYFSLLLVYGWFTLQHRHYTSIFPFSNFSVSPRPSYHPTSLILISSHYFHSLFTSFPHLQLSTKIEGNNAPPEQNHSLHELCFHLSPPRDSYHSVWLSLSLLLVDNFFPLFSLTVPWLTITSGLVDRSVLRSQADNFAKY